VRGQRIGAGGKHGGDFRSNDGLEKLICDQGNDLVSLIAPGERAMGRHGSATGDECEHQDPTAPASPPGHSS
jgi:hypothetical protein